MAAGAIRAVTNLAIAVVLARCRRQPTSRGHATRAAASAGHASHTAGDQGDYPRCLLAPAFLRRENTACCPAPPLVVAVSDGHIHFLLAVLQTKALSTLIDARGRQGC